MPPVSNQKWVYPSAVDRWVACVLLLSPGVSIVLGLVLLSQQRFDAAFYLFIAGALATIGTAACCLPCRYSLLEDAVAIRCGLVVYHVPYRSIRRVERSTTWRNGPALSLRRVVMVTDRKIVVVSPENRDDFVSRLRERIATSR